jgi:hypothetical protein
LTHYRRSLRLFSQLRDKEHEGIACLKVAEASIRGGEPAEDAVSCLDSAEAIFMGLGWKEGHARVWEQRAQLDLALTKREKAAEVRRSLLGEAAAATRKAQTLYESIQNGRGLGRTDSLFKQIGLEKRSRE